jgi:hypothetical protein
MRPPNTHAEQSPLAPETPSRSEPVVRSTAVICLASGLLICPPGVVLGDSAESRFTVSVTVPVLAELSILDEPNPMLLSAEDVARGYKLVSARYRVSCNARRGYLIQFTPRLGLAHTIEIAGLGYNVIVQDEAVEVRRPPVATAEEVALHLRLLLEPAVAPGRHVLPLLVTTVPL